MRLAESVASALCLAASLTALVLGSLLLAGPPRTLDLPMTGPLGPLELSGDAVSGPFLLLVGLLGFASTLASLRQPCGSSSQFLLLGFLAGMVLVPVAGDIFTLLLVWELMSLSPGLMLVLDPDAETRRAGITYLIYAHLSALLILVGLLIWNGPADATFSAITARPVPAGAAVLILLGALVKAGIMPFHSWLPEAHPVAPSHVSALMSGAMVALPAYLVVRLLFADGVPTPIAVMTLLLAALTAALGSLHALHARNLKRVLAMTTVAHMGTAFVLASTGLLLAHLGPAHLLPFVSSALMAYLLAHGLSKGALFLIAGEIHHAAHDLDLERLGGLWRSLGPLAFLAALGGLSLAGLPPLGGFMGEVSLFSTLFAALLALEPTVAVVLLGSLFLVGVATGAGVAAIAKVVWGAFHGPARHGKGIRPLRTAALLPAGVLLAASLLLGLLPGLLWQWLPAPSTDLRALATPLGPIALYAPSAVLLLLCLAAFALTRTMRRPRRVDPWNSGSPAPGMRQAYTPQALVMPYRILFAEILRPGSDLSLQEAPIAPFAPSRGRYTDPEPGFVEPWIHRPIATGIWLPIELLRGTHRGSVHAYLVVLLIVVVVLLFTAQALR